MRTYATWPPAATVASPEPASASGSAARLPPSGHATPDAQASEPRALLRVLHAPRIQRTLSLRTTTATRLIRGRRTIPTTHEGILIPRRRLKRVTLGARLPIPAVSPIGTRLALRTSRTRLALRARRPSRSRSANGSGLPSRSVRTIDAVLTGHARRTRRTRLPVNTIRAIKPIPARHTRRTRHPHTRLPTRPLHRPTAQLPHLLRQRPVIRALVPQITSLVHHLNRQPAQNQHDQRQRQTDQPLSPRQPCRPAHLLMECAHFDTTAQIAIAADSNASRTGTVS